MGKELGVSLLRRDLATRGEACSAVFAYLEGFYNGGRGPSALGYL